jgi:hypothetical protein
MVNWARFGSVLDTGYRYVLSFDNLAAAGAESFSPAYLVPNLWMFLLNPFEVHSRFPFLSVVSGRAPLLPYQGQAGKYHIEPTAGLLAAAPFALFALIAAAELAAFAWAGLRRRGNGDPGGRQLPAWTLLSLSLSVVFASGVVLFYYDVRIRYLAEFVPSLMLLSVLGAFEGYHLLQSRAVIRAIYTVFVLGIAMASSSMSLLLAMAENARRFRHYSPHLMRQLVLFFSR